MDSLSHLFRQRASSATLCSSCLQALRRQNTFRTSKIIRYQSREKHIARQGEQATPLSGFYEALLSSSLSSTRPAAVKVKRLDPSAPRSPPPKPAKSGDSKSSSSPKDDVQARARIVFGSRLAGPIARKSERDRQSTYIAGVLVPPKPAEPDNCCMSGCVNCVWDIYREDLEEWAAKATEARRVLHAQGKEGTIDERRLHHMKSSSSGAGLAGGAQSMDDDGGGSEANWDSGIDLTSPPKAGEDLFANIPVGIREFMRTEKMLKERHAEEARHAA